MHIVHGLSLADLTTEELEYLLANSPSEMEKELIENELCSRVGIKKTLRKTTYTPKDDNDGEISPLHSLSRWELDKQFIARKIERQKLEQMAFRLDLAKIRGESIDKKVSREADRPYNI